MTNLGTSLCNSMFPTWKKDENVISDMEKLPISAISYGKMISEAQAAKVLLGPLVCQPKEDLYNSEEHLRTDFVCLLT